MQPTPDEIREWSLEAKRRKAVLPSTLQMQGRYVVLVCGICEHAYRRKLLPGRDDPVMVCPSCKTRNYVPIEW